MGGLPSGQSLKRSGCSNFPTMNKRIFALLAEVATMTVTRMATNKNLTFSLLSLSKVFVEGELRW